MYKRFLMSKFAGCHLLATGFDPHRQCDIFVYVLEDRNDVVGLLAMNDPWISTINVLPELKLVDKMKAYRDRGSSKIKIERVRLNVHA